MRHRHHPLPALLLTLATAPGLAQAADGTFTSEAAFAAAAGSTVVESFEALAAQVRSLAPVVAPGFTVSAVSTPIGLQVGPDNPLPGFGAAATDGSHYLSAYLPGVPQGSIRFTLLAPTTVFGFNLIDVGESAGTVSLQTNAGTYAAGVTLVSTSGGSPSGSVLFVGITQATPFTTVDLTVTGIDEAYGVDRVFLSAVPEPASAALLLCGLLGMAGMAGMASSAGRRAPAGLKPPVYPVAPARHRC